MKPTNLKSKLIFGNKVVYMSREHKFRIGNQLILSWIHFDNLSLGQLISNAIGEKDLASIDDQELINLIEKYCSK